MNCSCHLLGLSHLLLYPVVMRACRRTLTMMAPTISVVGGGRLGACATSSLPPAVLEPRPCGRQQLVLGGLSPAFTFSSSVCVFYNKHTLAGAPVRGWGGRGPCWQRSYRSPGGWLTIKTLTGRVGLVHKPSECVDKVSSEWSDDDGKGEAELVEMNQAQLLTSH